MCPRRKPEAGGGRFGVLGLLTKGTGRHCRRRHSCSRRPSAPGAAPSDAIILFDGRDAGAFSLRSLRQQIGYVSQEAELFHASIRENILMGRPEADAATFEAAVRAAHVDDFVRTLPEGYDTIVGDRGVKLSGGQRQRIAIARALLRRPALFIFDEATSALDRDSEAFIQQTINEIARDATVLIISHRPAAVRDADRIYRLDGRGGVAIVDRAEQTDLAN